MIVRVGAFMTDQDKAEAAMIEVCCDALETAMAAGVLKATRLRGVLYIAVAGRHFPVDFCPFCGRARERRASTDRDRGSVW
jgi:hypothetical protein